MGNAPSAERRCSSKSSLRHQLRRPSKMLKHISPASPQDVCVYFNNNCKYPTITSSKNSDYQNASTGQRSTSSLNVEDSRGFKDDPRESKQARNVHQLKVQKKQIQLKLNAQKNGVNL